jgi:hypothetical protein
LKYTFLNDQWVTEEIREEMKKFLESNENENITCQNLLDPYSKGSCKRQLIPMSAYIKRKPQAWWSGSSDRILALVSMRS